MFAIIFQILNAFVKYIQQNEQENVKKLSKGTFFLQFAIKNDNLGF